MLKNPFDGFKLCVGGSGDAGFSSGGAAADPGYSSDSGSVSSNPGVSTSLEAQAAAQAAANEAAGYGAFWSNPANTPAGRELAAIGNTQANPSNPSNSDGGANPYNPLTEPARYTNYQNLNPNATIMSQKAAMAQIEPTRPGYIPQMDLGDRATQELMRGGYTASQSLLLQMEQAKNTPTLTDDRYFANEYQKSVQNIVELSANEHYRGIASGLPTGPNPYEYSGDLALGLLKGVQGKSGAQVTTPVNLDVLGGSRYGAQNISWDAAIRGEAPNYTELRYGTDVLARAMAERTMGPYGELRSFSSAYGVLPLDIQQMIGFKAGMSAQRAGIGWDIDVYTLQAPGLGSIMGAPIVSIGQPIGKSTPMQQGQEIAPQPIQFGASIIPGGFGLGFGVQAANEGVNDIADYSTPMSIESGMNYGLIQKPFQSGGKSDGNNPFDLSVETIRPASGNGVSMPSPHQGEVVIWNTLVNMWETKSILPQSQRVYLPPPDELFGTSGKSRMGDILIGVPYGQIKGAETIRAQEAYEKSPIPTQYQSVISDYETSNAALKSSLAVNKDYVRYDEASNKYIISPNTPTVIANELTKNFDTVAEKSKIVTDFTETMKQYEYNSPFNKLQRETTQSFGDQKPFEMFGIQPTVAWKTGIDTLTYGLVGGNTGVLSGTTSRTASNPGESIQYGAMDFPVMTIKAIADAPLGAEMTIRDVSNRGSTRFSTVAGYGQAQFGKYIVDDPVRGITMLATGHAIGSVTRGAKNVVLERTGLTRMSSYEVTGGEVVANAPATRTIADILNKDTIDVTHSSPAPIRGGLAQISRESAGDVAHGNAPAPGIFGAPIVKEVGTSGRTLFEPTSNYFLNKPLLWPAIVNTARTVYNIADATINMSGDYSRAADSARSAARGYVNTIVKYTPGVGGSREYIIRNVETLAPELRGQYAQLATDIRTQLETQGFLESATYDAYTRLAYEKSANQGGAPIAIIAPKKASGYHLGMKEAMGAPFESEVYMVAARRVNGIVTPLDAVRITSRDFKGYAYGPSGAKVVEIGVEGIPNQRTPFTTSMRENAAFNRDHFHSVYNPRATLWNTGGATIQRGWYEAAKQDAILKAQEMYGEPGYWSPKGYYGQHGYEHSVAVARNIRDIISRSPETEQRLGGVDSADRYANAMGLSHDIAKIGEAESQPYTHAFVAAEAIRSGELQRQMGAQTYNKMFGGMSRADIVEVSKAVSEHTQIQPARMPGLGEAIGNPSSIVQPALGIVSEVMWRPSTAGRTLATADRMDIGRVGASVRQSKLFRTPEEQRAANIDTATVGATIGASILSAKMGLPPVVVGIMLSDVMFGKKRDIQPYGKTFTETPASIYSGRGPPTTGVMYHDNTYTDHVGYPMYPQYSSEYPTTKYNAPKYSIYEPNYNNEYSPYSPAYDKTYSNYEPRYSKYAPKYELGYDKVYSKYEPGYKPGYSPYEPKYEPGYKPYVPYEPYGYKPYKPYEKPPYPPYGANPGGGGSPKDSRKRRRKVELFSFEMGQDTRIPTRYGLAGKTTNYVPGTRGIAADILPAGDIAPNRLFDIGRRSMDDRL